MRAVQHSLRACALKPQPRNLSWAVLMAFQQRILLHRVHEDYRGTQERLRQAQPNQPEVTMGWVKQQPQPSPISGITPAFYFRFRSCISSREELGPRFRGEGILPLSLFRIRSWVRGLVLNPSVNPRRQEEPWRIRKMRN